MNDDMPWVNLTQDEVEELRNKKHELTEYGKQKLKEMMTKPLQARVSTEDYNKVVNAMNTNYIPDDDVNEETSNWKTIFKDLTDDSGCYEIDKVNIYQLTSHLEELYVRIKDLEQKSYD